MGPATRCVLLLEKPGRTRREPPRCWHGQSVVRRVPVEDADGRLDVAEIRFLVVHSSQLAQQGPQRMPPKPKRPSVSPSTSSAWKPAGLPVRPTPRRPSATRKAGAGTARPARCASGALMFSTIMWKQSAPQKADAARPSAEGRSPQVEVRYRLRVHPEALLPAGRAAARAKFTAAYTPP